MKRPPLISFLTFNRLGNTAVSLPTLLRTADDFELYIVDNGSKDATWQFLNDTKDPRIKFRYRFDENIGVVHGLNFILSHRKEDQDFINLEYDYRIHNKNFVKDFRIIHNEFPEMAAISGTIYPDFYDKIKRDRLLIRNQQKVFLDYILGYCVYIPYETMNQLMYYNEVDCFGDIELNLRFRAMKKVMGYAVDIHVSHIKHGGECDTCIAYHSYCSGYDKIRVPECVKYYQPFVSKIMDTINMMPRYAVIRNKCDKLNIFPQIYCDSVFSGIQPKLFDENESYAIMDLFKKYTRKYYEKVEKE